MKKHELKTWVKYFNDLECGFKTFELRKNDRDFKIGDFLCLCEYDHIKKEYTGRKLFFMVTSIFEGGDFGLKRGYVIMSISRVGL